jgi:hypothetical protein
MSGKKIQSFVRISFSASVSVLAIMTGTQAFAQSGTAASATAPEIVDGAVPFAETSGHADCHHRCDSSDP